MPYPAFKKEQDFPLYSSALEKRRFRPLSHLSEDLKTHDAQMLGKMQNDGSEIIERAAELPAHGVRDVGVDFCCLDAGVAECCFPPPFLRRAASAPGSAVAELGVVRPLPRTRLFA